MPRLRRATIYFKPQVYRALKITAATSDRAVSDLVNDAVRQALREDALDRQAFRKSRKERSIPLSKVLRELKRDGLL
jgi:hypothetical protein